MPYLGCEADYQTGQSGLTKATGGHVKVTCGAETLGYKSSLSAIHRSCLLTLKNTCLMRLTTATGA